MKFLCIIAAEKVIEQDDRGEERPGGYKEYRSHRRDPAAAVLVDCNGFCPCGATTLRYGTASINFDGHSQEHARESSGGYCLIETHDLAEGPGEVARASQVRRRLRRSPQVAEDAEPIDAGRPVHWSQPQPLAER